ncbi:MAG TPA: tRNA (adenosine(37)-N6)-threonylcarbamoyltransferase complex transferase subunit TsaD [Candidatus Korarchaeota archaeon]|nr:tRNA (adenosine(37)-N6)-threonylcarbamoyltransferase complex transferase subunit TsaD [Candidatus Korarchaeota archaeon]
MIALGIESTAHTYGVGIANDRGRILANVNKVFRTERGGMKPAEVTEHHYRVAKDVVHSAIEQSGLNYENIDLVGFSRGPGLGSTLLVGAIVARILAERLGIPLVGVNHAIAHIEIGRLMARSQDPLIVFVSGGNTQIMVNSGKAFRIIGETLDIGLGNALDKVGRGVGLPFPAGRIMDEIRGEWISLPYTVKGMDLAFSGIVTEALRRYKAGSRLEDVVWSFMEVTFSMLVEATERALAYTKKDELLLVGGVAASPRLREKMEVMCKERNVKLGVTPPEYSRDNGAMIAYTSILSYKIKGPLKLEESSIKPKWRVDDVSWPLLPLPP